MGGLVDKIKKHKKILCLGAGLCVAYGGYRYYKSKKRIDDNSLFYQQHVIKNNVSIPYQTRSLQEEEDPLPTFHRHNTRRKSNTITNKKMNGSIALAIQQSLRVEKLMKQCIRLGSKDRFISQVSYIQDSEILSPETIVQILQYSVELASDEYVQATLANRAERRKARKLGKIHLYEKLIREYSQEVDIILERGQAEILYRLDIHKDIFELSLVELMDRGLYQQLFMLQASVKQKIKEKIPSRKNLTRNQIKDIIRYNIQILKSKNSWLDIIIQRLQADEEERHLVPMALGLMIQDLIYEKFGVEEEDQIRNLQQEDNLSDSEILQLLGQIEQCMQVYATEMGFGGIDQIPENLDSFS